MAPPLPFSDHFPPSLALHLIEQMPLAAQIWQLGDDGSTLTLAFANESSEVITNVAIATAINGSLGEVFPEFEKAGIGDTIRNTIETQAAIHIEATLPGAAGEKILRLNAVPLCDNLAALLFEDITAFRRRAQRRADLDRKLEQAKRLTSLGRLAASVAHEFNNVLMGIQPFVEIVRTYSGGRAAPLDRAAHQMDLSIRRGKRLTDEILDFTRSTNPVIRPVSLSALIESLLPEIEFHLGPAITLSLDVDRELIVPCDDTQIGQVLLNLVVNARDAMPSGGHLAISAERATERDACTFPLPIAAESLIHITVRDTGSRIDPETQRHIFEPLFTTKRRGTGLGLAITHQIISAHHGAVFLDSAPGEGTTFHLYLPLSPEKSERQAREESRSANVREIRVLLVEDDVMVASAIATALELEGLDVETVHNGTDALSRLSSFDPQAVVLDLRLPGMAGTEVFEQIRGQRQQLPVIFSTAQADDYELADYLRQESVALLSKPYEIATLVQLVDRMTGC